MARPGRSPTTPGAISFTGWPTPRPNRLRDGSSHGQRATFRPASRKRQQGASAVVDSITAREPADRRRRPRTAEVAIQRHAATLRRDGGAVPQAGWHADERNLALPDGVERQ